MQRSRLRHTLTGRLFAVYAVVSAIPVLALGLILAASFRGQARERGLGEGRSVAAVIARTAIEPLLDGRPLTAGLTAVEKRRLQRLAHGPLGRSVLRMRLRDRSGHVVFSEDREGYSAPPTEHAIAAAHGRVIAHLTWLNADTELDDRVRGVPARRLGPRAIEIYMPLRAGRPAHVVGSLELYLPYTLIGSDVARLLSTLYRDLALGLGALYLILFAIAASVSGRLRRESLRNAFLAGHDVLTGLPNRTAFRDAAAQAATAAARQGGVAAIAVLDLDRFREINDALGHANGDAVLRELAGRLAAMLGDEAFVARLGGDEYGMVLRDGARAEALLRRVRTTLENEVSVAGVTLAAQSSIGYALSPADGDDPDTLLQRADVAMYAAKDQHAGVVRYTPSLDEHDAAGLSLVAELRHAIDDEQLLLHYQPLQRLDGDRVVALEALVRWEHPAHGLLFPDRFLGPAEQTDVIDHLTRWVLRRALRDTDRLAGATGVAPRVAVNVSARSVGGGTLADDVIAALTELSVDPDRLIVEVTETAILADPPRAVAELERLRAAGVRISLDDFGQGQTSLRHLSALPLHELKIDREFVGDMDSDEAHATIVRSMIELGHNLGLQVVAEGVETETVREQLREAGADLIQGYLLSRPLALEQLALWLSDPADTALRA
ncbi:MAG TPA: EAL domain-containing protein [Solirubrobacteraceae bacterium]|nr:EAL domain-containing protein [Solirubrobacteraceae bacterium]